MIRSAVGDPEDFRGDANPWYWIELWAKDPQAMARFYGELAGYEIDPKPLRGGLPAYRRPPARHGRRQPAVATARAPDITLAAHAPFPPFLQRWAGRRRPGGRPAVAPDDRPAALCHPDGGLRGAPCPRGDRRRALDGAAAAVAEGKLLACGAASDPAGRHTGAAESGGDLPLGVLRTARAVPQPQCKTPSTSACTSAP